MKKKIFKIIQIIYDILSLGFIVFISIAMALAPKLDSQPSKDSDSSLVYEKKGRHNLIKGSSNSVVFTNGIVSDDFLIACISVTDIVNSYLRDPTITSASIRFDDNTDPVYVAGWNMINYDTLTPVYTAEDYKVGYLEIVITSARLTPLPLGMDFEFHFQDILGDDLFYFKTIMFMYNNTFNSVDKLSFCFNNYSIQRVNTSVVNDPNFGLIFSNEGLFSTIINASNHDNYLQGFANGKEVGYNLGYVAGSNGLNSNVFTIMGQAFSSIANIFSIELLPGFPLWILVFAPLIVAVVIVVVKMIKG